MESMPRVGSYRNYTAPFLEHIRQPRTIDGNTQPSSEHQIYPKLYVNLFHALWHSHYSESCIYKWNAIKFGE